MRQTPSRPCSKSIRPAYFHSAPPITETERRKPRCALGLKPCSKRRMYRSTVVPYGLSPFPGTSSTNLRLFHSGTDMGPSGELRGIIYEVNNTFGETHAYVAPVSEDGGAHEADKAFHVSPFFDVSGNYRFRMRAPTDKLGLVVDNVLQGKRVHMASIKAREQAVSTQSLFQLAFTNPLSTIGVTVGIHWQALKIWLRKAGYRRKPPPPSSPVTVAKELPESASNRSMEAA